MSQPFGRVKLVSKALWDDESTQGNVVLKVRAAADTTFQITTDNEGVESINPTHVIVRGGDKVSQPFQVRLRDIRGRERGYIYGSADPASVPVGEVRRASILVVHRVRILAFAGIGSVSIGGGGVVTGGMHLSGNRVQRAQGSTGQVDVALTTDNPAILRIDPQFVSVPSSGDFSQEFTIFTVAEHAPAFGCIYGSSGQGLIIEGEIEVV